MWSSFKRSEIAVVAQLCCMLGLLLIAGCSQDDGQECQLDSDCSSGLVCDRAKLSERGVCRDPKTLNTSKDAGAKSDAAEPHLSDEDSGAPAGDDAGSSDHGDAG
jgi:hypothetical protein